MKHKFLTKRILTILSVGIMAFSLVSCGKSAEQNKSENSTVKIRVGYFGTSQYQTQLAIAKEKGYFDEAFKDMNVEVEYNFFAGAGPAINEAALSGEIDVAFGVGDQPTLSGISNGNENIIVSRIVKNARGTGILVGYNSDINSIEKLKGKKVAVGVGTANQKTLDLLLEDVGLTEEDVEVVNLSKIDEQLAAISSNKIDAAFTANLSYGIKKAEENKIARLLTDCESHPNYAYLSINKKFIDNNTDIVQKFIDALYKADKWYAENQEEGMKIVSKFLNIDFETVKQGNESCDIQMIFNDEDIDNLKVTYDFMEKNNLLQNKIENLSAIINDSFIKKSISNN